MDPYYRVTGNFYITVIIFRGVNFGIALHSLYRKYFPAECFGFTLHYLDRNPQVAPLLCFHYITLNIPAAN